MPAVDHVNVTPADLVAHAASMGAVADRVATAKQAGDAVRMGAGAYGKLCTMVPVLLNGLSGLLVDGIDNAAHSLHDTAERLRAAADSYKSSDERAAAAHSRIRDAL
jgi:Excreted virulence factor EspC, type VII ESX diderm